MDITIRGKHFDVPQRVQERARDKFSRLQHYLPLLNDGVCEVDLAHEKAKEPDRRFVVHVNVSAHGVHLRVEAAFKVCPPDEGLAEIRRKHIELTHGLISLLSSMSEAELEDPLRAEKLRREIMVMANEKVLRKSRVIDVFITAMELE